MVSTRSEVKKGESLCVSSLPESSQPGVAREEETSAREESHGAVARVLPGNAVVLAHRPRVDELTDQPGGVHLHQAARLQPLVVRGDGELLQQGLQAARGQPGDTAVVGLETLTQAGQVRQHHHLVLRHSGQVRSGQVST